jgi:hypothetical protein
MSRFLVVNFKSSQQGVFMENYFHPFLLAYLIDFPRLLSHVLCRTPILTKCGGEAQHLEKSGVGVLRDSRMFRARQQGPKHLALVIWTSAAQVMGKRRAGSQTGSLTPEH